MNSEDWAIRAAGEASALNFMVAGLFGALRDRGVLTNAEIAALFDAARMRAEQARSDPDGPGAGLIDVTIAALDRHAERFVAGPATPKPDPAG